MLLIALYSTNIAIKVIEDLNNGGQSLSLDMMSKFTSLDFTFACL